MATITANKLARAVVVVGAVIEQRIDESARQATRYRDLLYLLKRLEPPTGRDSRAPGIPEGGKSALRARIAPGSIPDRILEIVGESGGEPMSLAAILSAKHGAKDSLAKTAVRQLVKSGHLVATGATLSRRFSLPAKRKG